MKTLYLVLVVLVLVVSQGSAQNIVNAVVGRSQVLDLDPKPPGKIGRVVWKHGENMAAEWTNEELSYYGVFEGHALLDPTSGRLTISRVTMDFQGEYSVEIDNKFQEKKYIMKVYEPLPTPSIRVTPLTCGSNRTLSCVLVCDLNPNLIKDVSYEWDLHGETVKKISGKELTINSDTKATEFTCRAKDPVSERASKSEKNPFLPAEPSNGSSLGLGLGIPAAVIAVALMVAAGVYFFKKKPPTTTTTTTRVQPSETEGLNTGNGGPGEDNVNQGRRGNHPV